VELQQSIGNQAVQRLIRSPYIQSKLKVSTPGDQFEQEADRVADTVMRMPEPETTRGETTPVEAIVQRVPLAVREDEEADEKKVSPKLDANLSPPDEEKKEETLQAAPMIQRQMEEEDQEEVQRKFNESPRLLYTPTGCPAHGAIQRLCKECEGEKEREGQPLEMVHRKPAPDDDDEEEWVQPKGTQTPARDVTTTLAHNIHALNGGGSQLPDTTRAFFEPRFGADFSHVRVHTDSRATETAKSINARAFTVGHNITFEAGQYAPHSHEGRQLLAHELTHVVQQSAAQTFVGRSALEITPSNALTVQRSGAPDAGASDPATSVPKLVAPASQQRYGVSLAGDDGVVYAGIFFPPNATLLRQALEELMSAKGTGPAEKILDNLESSASTISAERSDRSGVDAETELLDKFNARLKTIIPNLRETRAAIKRDHEKFIQDFETQAKANVRATLTTSEETAKREAVRYGITEEKIGMFMGAYLTSAHHMQTGTPVVSGLQKAAGVLLARRQKVDLLRRKQWAATRMEHDPWDPKGRILVPDEPKYSQLGVEVKAESESYEQLRSAIASEYPVLAAVSELNKDTSDLETISKKGAGDETAEIIGAQITERLANIQKVRTNLDDKSEINIWRLPPVVDVVSVQLGAQTSPLKKLWVSEQVEEEKPGMLGSIALLIFNLLALALAPVTGGISLAVAAGVNVIATGLEVHEFMMQKALAGTDFDKARSLSQDEPSLFWLAVSIVGTVFDVVGAASAIKAFRALAPLAKAAEAAKGGKEAEAAMEALELAARKAGGSKLAEKVVANVRRARGGESLALEAAGATKFEREALEAAAKTTESEVADLIGASVHTTGGDLKLSKAGHLFSCTSPCSMLREKYAAALAKDWKLEGQLAKIEKRALDAAAEAKRGGPKANDLVEAVKKDAKALEEEIRKTHPSLVPASSVEDAAALQQIKLVEAEAASAGKRLKPDQLTAPPPKKPASVKENDPLWKEYEDYYATRYSAVKAEEKAGAAASKYPLEWGEYQSFRAKFLQGKAFLVNWAEMVGQDLTVPFKGQSRAKVISVTDTEVVLKIKSKSASGDITATLKKETFEKWVSEGQVTRWSLARQRLMASRPPYKAGLVEEVWAKAKKNGKIFDPNTGQELFWDAAKNRWDQWHMGHKPGKKYSELVDSYVDGKITWEDFLKEYNNPENYWPEHPLANVGHAYE
jgi:hypothetical protein